MFRKLLTHTAIYGIAPQISKVAGFLVLPLITKELSDVDYGVYGVITAFMSAISIFSILGLRLILVNSYYHHPFQHKWLWRQIYGFLNLWNIIYAIILGTILYFIIPDEAIENRWSIIFLVAGTFVLFGQTATIGLTFFQLRQKPKQVALRSALSGIITVLFNVIFIVYFKMGYMGWFWSAFIAAIVYNASYWYPLNYTHKLKPIYNFKWRSIKRALKISLPILPHHYSSYLVDSSDRVIMDITAVSTSNIGKYNISYSIGNLFNALGIAAGYAMGPIMNEMYKDQNDKGARDIVFTMQLTFFCLTFVASIWLKEVFDLMIKNDSLKEMYYLTVIIAMSYNYRPMYLGAVNKLFYTENTHKLWRLTLGAGALNVLLNFIFIPYYGFEIAAVTTFISFMFMGYAGYYFNDFKLVNKVKFYPIVWLIVTILLTIIAYCVVDFKIIPKLLISSITLIILLFSIRKRAFNF